MTTVSAVLFAHDARRLARFYVGVFAARTVAQDHDHAALEIGDFRLVVHQIPARLNLEQIRTPPERREQTAIRLDYPVEDLVKARSDAQGLGGAIDEQPPGWAGPESRFFLGFDPEGNVFGVRECA